MKGFKLPGNMEKMMKQAQALQQKLAEVQEQAKTMSAEGSAGGGAVKAVANGKYELVSLSISKEVVNPEDIEMLQDLIITAVNQAFQKVQDQTNSALKQVTGGMNIPGM